VPDWSEAYEDVTPPPSDEERESTWRQLDTDERARERALARLEAGPVPWVSLPRGLPERLISEGLAEQQGVAFLRRRESKDHG